MWYVTHGPASLDGFIGKASVEEARKWAGGPLIIYGSTGTGKSTLARLLAAERGWELVEVTDENIHQAENIANTGSLFGNQKALLIEDVDAIKDIKAVGELAEKSKNPLIMTTSDFESKRLSTLKKKSAKIQLRRPLPASIAKHLQTVCEAEGVSAEKALLEKVAKNSSGDVRAALNDMETLANGRSKVSESDASGLLPERDRESDIYRALSVIFGGRDIGAVVESTWGLSEQPKDVLWWVEENTPRLYPDKNSINDSYRSLSRADIFLGRIMRRQYWGFLRYANTMMTAGVNVSRPAKVNYTQYMFPGYFAALGRSKGVRNMEDSIASKLAPHVHASAKVIRKEYVPLFRLLLAKGKVSDEELRELYRFNDDEMEYLAG
jgi:replication factor C large subunit